MAKTYVKLLVTIGCIVAGLSVIFYGMQFFNEISPNQSASKTYVLNNGSTNDRVILQLNSNSWGFVENNLITATPTFLFHEIKNNSTRVEISFPDAMIFSPTGIVAEGVIMKLKQGESLEKDMSRYTGKQEFMYQRSGTFKVVFSITNNDTAYMQSQFGTTEKTKQLPYDLPVEIKSANYYDSLNNSNKIIGLSYVMTGVSILGVTYPFIQIVDFLDEIILRRTKNGKQPENKNRTSLEITKPSETEQEHSKK